MPHMHERGVASRCTIAGPDGGDTAARPGSTAGISTGRSSTSTRAPPRLTAEAQMEMTCDYDTSMDDEPVFPGWGTRNEMCTAILMLAAG